MRICWSAQSTERSLVLLGVLTLSWSLGNISSRGQEEVVASNSLEDDSEVTMYWWGEWAKWTACTRTCGGGVMFQERHCLKQRKKAPVGKDNVTCDGTGKKYLLCNTKDCPASGRSFREEQCWSFNSQVYNGRSYHWKPLYPDDYVHISSNPCDLHCTTSDGQRQLMVPARDGTSCKYSNYRGVCVNGRCEPIGCDGVLFSSHTLDKCGVCQGNGSSCSRVTGNYRRGTSTLGYSFITQIPEGSWDIQIIERKKSADILAVTDQAGNFFFNGAYKVDRPQNFQAAGTIFKYRRPMDVYETGIEYIVAKGPINQPINVLVWNQNGRTPYITYEYTVMRDPFSTAPPPSLQSETARNGDTGAISPGVGHLSDNESMSEQNHILRDKSHTKPAGGHKGQETNEVYEGTAGVVCEQGTLTPCQYAERNGTHAVGAAGPVFPAGHRPSEDVPDSDNLIWSIMLGERIGSEELLINLSTNHLLGQEEGLYSSETEPLDLDYASLEHGTSHRLNSSLQELSVGHRRNETADFVFPNRTVLPVQRGGTRTNRTRTHQKVSQKNLRLSPADMYRWKLSSQEPCSMTCSIGVAKSFAMCVRYDGVEVDDTYCDALTRPEPVHDFCIGRECQPSWNGSLPNGAVAIYNGYVSRTDYVCKYNCEAGFYTPSKGPYCLYPYADREYYTLEFEVLVNEDNFEFLEWKEDSYGSVPQHSVRTCSGVNIFVGKNKYGLGKVVTQHEAFFLPWEGDEYWYKSYQVLTINTDGYSQHISHVEYDTDQIKLFHHPPEALQIARVSNLECQNVEKTVSLEKSSTEEKTWNIGRKTENGTISTMNAKIPILNPDNVHFSKEQTVSFSKGTTIVETISHSISVQITVPPKHSCTVRMEGKKMTADIPFTARLSRTYRNGNTHWTSVTGTYNGVSIGELNAVVDRCQPIATAVHCTSAQNI
ncbi:ADAMTS-like protein 2 [Arapaima gigas]